MPLLVAGPEEAMLLPGPTAVLTEAKLASSSAAAGDALAAQVCPRSAILAGEQRATH